MPHRLILKVTKFQLSPPKRLGTVVKNILGGHDAPPPMSNRVKGTPVTPQAIMKKYLMKAKDRLHNLEKSIISVTETQNIQDVYFPQIIQKLKALESKHTSNGGSRQNVDRVPSLKNLTKNEIFVHFHSNLGILTGFQQPCDPVWIRYCQ